MPNSQHNPAVMLAWQANMDILNPYACVMYIASYITKNNRAMGELLRRVARLVVYAHIGHQQKQSKATKTMQNQTN